MTYSVYNPYAYYIVSVETSPAYKHLKFYAFIEYFTAMSLGYYFLTQSQLILFIIADIVIFILLSRIRKLLLFKRNLRAIVIIRFIYSLTLFLWNII